RQSAVHELGSRASALCSCAGGMHRYSLWRDVRAVYPPSRLLFLILQVRPHRIVVAVLGSRGNWSSTEIGLNPQGRWMCQPAICLAHPLWLPRCDVHFGFSGAASASGKGPALMGLGGDARVQSIPRAANRTYGAEDTRQF